MDRLSTMRTKACGQNRNTKQGVVKCINCRSSLMISIKAKDLNIRVLEVAEDNYGKVLHYNIYILDI